MRITRRLLLQHGDCNVADFERAFPRGLKVATTERGRRRQAERAVGLDVRWAAYMLLCESAWINYDLNMVDPFTEYIRVHRAAWTKYARDQRSEYSQVQRVAMTEYYKVQAQALAKYRLAEAVAFLDEYYWQEETAEPLSAS